LWVVVKLLLRGDTSIPEFILFVAFTQLFLAVQYGAFWGLAGVGYALGRRLRCPGLQSV